MTRQEKKIASSNLLDPCVPHCATRREPVASRLTSQHASHHHTTTARHTPPPPSREARFDVHLARGESHPEQMNFDFVRRRRWVRTSTRRGKY